MPGDTEASALFELITLAADDPNVMPAEGEPLAVGEIARIRRWIEQGTRCQEPPRENETGAVEPPAREIETGDLETLVRAVLLPKTTESAAPGGQRSCLAGEHGGGSS